MLGRASNFKFQIELQFNSVWQGFRFAVLDTVSVLQRDVLVLQCWAWCFSFVMSDRASVLQRWVGFQICGFG